MSDTIEILVNKKLPEDHIKRAMVEMFRQKFNIVIKEENVKTVNVYDDNNIGVTISSEKSWVHEALKQ